MTTDAELIATLRAQIAELEVFADEDAKTIRRHVRSIRFLEERVGILIRDRAVMAEQSNAFLSSIEMIMSELRNVRRIILLNDVLSRLRRIDSATYARYMDSHEPEQRFATRKSLKRNGLSHLHVTRYPETETEVVRMMRTATAEWNRDRENDKDRMNALLFILRKQDYPPSSDIPEYIRIVGDVFKTFYPTYTKEPSRSVVADVAKMLDPLAAVDISINIDARLAALREIVNRKPHLPHPMTPDSE